MRRFLGLSQLLHRRILQPKPTYATTKTDLSSVTRMFCSLMSPWITSIKSFHNSRLHFVCQIRARKGTSLTVRTRVKVHKEDTVSRLRDVWREIDESLNLSLDVDCHVEFRGVKLNWGWPLVTYGLVTYRVVEIMVSPVIK
jgi:hypothetical protein